jgi:DNA-binding response OmpR family regulator
MPCVLVVDDEVTVRELIVDVLEDEGFSTLQAVDGAEALELLASYKPDLITLDLNMPTMGGSGFLRRIRDVGVSVPIIVISAYGAEGARRDLGANDALAKPFDIDELVRRVRDLLP